MSEPTKDEKFRQVEDFPVRKDGHIIWYKSKTDAVKYLLKYYDDQISEWLKNIATGNEILYRAMDLKVKVIQTHS